MKLLYSVPVMARQKYISSKPQADGIFFLTNCVSTRLSEFLLTKFFTCKVINVTLFFLSPEDCDFYSNRLYAPKEWETSCHPYDHEEGSSSPMSFQAGVEGPTLQLSSTNAPSPLTLKMFVEIYTTHHVQLIFFCHISSILSCLSITTY